MQSSTMVNMHNDWQGSKNWGTPSKSNVKNFIHFYFTILGTKQNTIDVKIDNENTLDLERMFKKIHLAGKDLTF